MTSLRVSCAVHVYNEAAAVVRLIRSSLPMAPLIGEWLVLDHRSTDDLAGALDAVEPDLASHGVSLTRLHEARDLSAAHTFAAVRTRTIKACRFPVVALMDADFLLGPRFEGFLRRSLDVLLAPESRVHAATYAVPCVWDTLTTDAEGVVREHGRVWVHGRRPRILWRDAVRYEQTKDRGRWERLVLTDRTRPGLLHLTRLGDAQQRLTPDSVVSVNVKPPARIALRDTMTMFLQDAVSKGQRGGWLENYAEGRVRSQGPYAYDQATVKGWRLHAPDVRLQSESTVSA